MKTNWNVLLAELGAQFGVVRYCRRKPLSDRVKAKMVVVLRRRRKLATVHHCDRSLICLMRDTKRNPYANVEKLKPKKEQTNGDTHR